ncbi:dephospho-CoA kinase [Carnobacterium iners]|uniref:Dephospho-CoA kinase n=1 Tax=Carnobacterium iners TaxID=1073423 RepID=A0A1X7NQW1_9LACT|nr:dephospho-CoA kinase [Carnobacterium iners]SEK27656.1 dephospho-CoA kinase [Carnobacterium iners]SMH40041.1 dephospho-CoA kinase [Carnobacterium iners]
MAVILGLTGGIATGKSTASNYFKKLKIPVVDADIGSRIIVEPGTDGLRKIVAHFGESILNSDGTLNRKALGIIVFYDEKQLATLNGILEEYIRKWISNQIIDYLKISPPLIVLDIPLLYERDYLSEVDSVMVVVTTKEVQLERLMKRDKVTKEAAEIRIKTQLPLKNKIKRADKIIDNNYSVENTQKQIEDWLKEKNLIE